MDAVEKFKQIGEAYSVLGDEEKRPQYDRYGTAWQAVQEGNVPPSGPEFGFEFGGEERAGGYSGFFGRRGFSSFFEHLFGAGAASRWEGPVEGDEWKPAVGIDHEAILSLTLEQAFEGGRHQIALRHPLSGKTRTYAVNVPPGVRQGQRLRLAGQGPAGDLCLMVRILPHPRFRLEGRDVYTTLEIAPWVAALGGKVRLQALRGDLQVSVPPGSSSSRKIRLKGEGFPDAGGQRGDLYAEIRIAVPQKLSSEQRALFEKLAEVAPSS